MSFQKCRPRTDIALPSRDKFMASLNRIPIDSLPSEERDCMVCRGPYGGIEVNSIQFRETPELPILLTCGHAIGADCLALWLEAKNNFRFNNTCPLCRRVLYISAVDARVLHLRDLINNVQNSLFSMEWEERREYLIMPRIASYLTELDDIINNGAALGEGIYHPSEMQEYNSYLVKKWWDCTLERHFNDFYYTIPVEEMGIGNEALDLHTDAVINGMPMVNRAIESKWEDIQGLCVAVSSRLLQGSSTSNTGFPLLEPSRHPTTVHHSMMPSSIFARLILSMQAQLEDQGFSANQGWDILDPEDGDTNQQLCKTLVLYEALICAAHAIDSPVRYIV